MIKLARKVLTGLVLVALTLPVFAGCSSEAAEAVDIGELTGNYEQIGSDSPGDFTEVSIENHVDGTYWISLFEMSETDPYQSDGTGSYSVPLSLDDNGLVIFQDNADNNYAIKVVESNDTATAADHKNPINIYCDANNDNVFADDELVQTMNYRDGSDI